MSCGRCSKRGPAALARPGRRRNQQRTCADPSAARSSAGGGRVRTYVVGLYSYSSDISRSVVPGDGRPTHALCPYPTAVGQPMRGRARIRRNGHNTRQVNDCGSGGEGTDAVRAGPNSTVSRSVEMAGKYHACGIPGQAHRSACGAIHLPFFLLVVSLAPPSTTTDSARARTHIGVRTWQPGARGSRPDWSGLPGARSARRPVFEKKTARPCMATS
jgi:hypothetical protein